MTEGTMLHKESLRYCSDNEMDGTVPTSYSAKGQDADSIARFGQESARYIKDGELH